MPESFILSGDKLLFFESHLNRTRMKQIYLTVRKSLIIALTLFFVIVTKGQDLPGASPNVQPLPVGTIIIGMDNVTQATSALNAGTGTYLFNLKSYGLVVFLLDVSFPVKWAIRSGKAHDGIDFTAQAERVTPSYLPPQTYDFKAGPFIIPTWDTLSIISSINIFNAGLPDSCKVKVYRTTAPVYADIRYELTRPPRAALLHDSCQVHKDFMEEASVPSSNYECVDDAYNLSRDCYTIVTAPHTGLGDTTWFDADSIESFVLQGGNFLAQCEGVKTFESLKKFQSVSGILAEPTNQGVNTMNDQINQTYPNADMSFGQFEGQLFPRLRGAYQQWRYTSSTINNWYPVITEHKSTDPTLYYTASVSKHTSGMGSLVFYLGNHEFYTDGDGCYQCVQNGSLNAQHEVNGIRAYLNAVLTPSKFMSCVYIWEFPLSVKLGNFNAYKQSNQTVKLIWNSLTEKENQYYIIEYSRNGHDYTSIGQVEGLGDSDTGHDYEFIHTNPQAGLNFYRLRMISLTGQASLSEVRKVIFDTKTQQLHIYPNPASSMITLLLDTKDGERLNLKIFDATGRLVKQELTTIRNQHSELNIEKLSKGIYWVVGTLQNGKEFKSKLVVQ